MTAGGRVLVLGAVETHAGMGLVHCCRQVETLGMEAVPVTTAVVARDVDGRLWGLHVTPPRFVAGQMDAAVRYSRPDACIVSMLARHTTVAQVAERLKRREIGKVVLAPVMGTQNGRTLLTATGVKWTLGLLVPRSSLVILSAANAEEMLDCRAGSREGARRAAAELVARGAEAALVYGTFSDGWEAGALAGGNRQELAERAAGAVGDHASWERLCAIAASGLAAGEGAFNSESVFQNGIENH
mgnify:FL=1